MKKRITASAIAWDEHTMDAPAVARQGEGELADELVREARRYGVPVVADDSLAERLSEVVQGEEIPQSSYQSVAELLVSLQARRNDRAK